MVRTPEKKGRRQEGLGPSSAVFGEICRLEKGFEKKEVKLRVAHCTGRQTSRKGMAREVREGGPKSIVRVFT